MQINSYPDTVEKGLQLKLLFIYFFECMCVGREEWEPFKRFSGYLIVNAIEGHVVSAVWVSILLLQWPIMHLDTLTRY